MAARRKPPATKTGSSNGRRRGTSDSGKDKYGEKSLSKKRSTTEQKSEDVASREEELTVQMEDECDGSPSYEVSESEGQDDGFDDIVEEELLEEEADELMGEEEEGESRGPALQQGRKRATDGKKRKRQGNKNSAINRASSCGSDDFGSFIPEMTDFPTKFDVALPNTGSGTETKTLSVPSRAMGDLMSSYLIIRSFSWQLRLSPFPCEAFLQAIMSHEPNVIVDELHVSLLRALYIDAVRAERHEMELNIEHLDFMTWPSFVWDWLRMMGYTIKHIGSDEDDEDEEDADGDHDESRNADEKDQVDESKAEETSSSPRTGAVSLDLKTEEGEEKAEKSLLSLFNSPVVSEKEKKISRPEYHLLPLDIKASILKTMCDHLIERPSVRAEIDRRESNGEIIAGRGGRGGAFPIMTEQEMDKANTKALQQKQIDANSEKCVLCGLGGVLMCCDGCPAAYHMRCAGESGRINDMKRWRCPECLCGGRGESAGLRLAVAGIDHSGCKVYVFNGMVIVCQPTAYILEGIDTIEEGGNLAVSLHFGEDALAIVNTMIRPKRPRVDPTSLDAVCSFPEWPSNDLPCDIDIYINKYRNGWSAAAAAMRSHVEDSRKRRARDKMWIPHGTCNKVVVTELPAPMSVSRYEWPHLNSRIGRSTVRCGRCYSCVRPNLRRACLKPVVKSEDTRTSNSKISYLIALISKIEREFWPLAEREWASKDGGHSFRNKWIAGVREASSIQELKMHILSLETALRPICFTNDWYKYYPSKLLSNAAEDDNGGDNESALKVDGATPLPDILADNRRKTDVYEISSDMDIGSFVRSHGQWTSRYFKKQLPPGKNKLGPPKFLIRQAVLNAGRKPIPGVKYRQGVWRMNSKRLNWISEVENSENSSELALALRKLDAALRWEAASKPRLAMQTVYSNTRILGKQVGEDGTFEYAVDASGSGVESLETETDMDTDLATKEMPSTAVWTPESKLPLWLIKVYEESRRRISAKTAMQAMQTLPRTEKDPEAVEDPAILEKRKREEAIAGDAEGHICSICYNTNESHLKSRFIKCKLCSREFHGYCVVMTNEEVQAAPEGEWTCPGCIASEKLIARLIKEPKAGQNLPGVNPKDEKPRENKKHPGRPPKPFFERADYKTAERKEILRKLSEAEHPELFDIAEVREESEEPQSPREQPVMPYDGLMHDSFAENPTNCPVCQYPDLGRPLISCTICAREFHKECLGIISNDTKLWDMRTIKCAECSGKRVRAPSESTILMAIEAAQEPANNFSSIQDRVKQRSQRARQAKEAQKAEDANKANWMEAADRVLTRVYRMQVAEPFRFPIAVESLPDYTNYVENPMDLETIRDELYSFESPLDVVKRIKLIVDNCVAYNGEDSKVTGQANHMMNSFSRLWKKERLPLTDDDEISEELLAKVGQPDEPQQDAPYQRIAHLMTGEPASDWQRKAGKVLSQLSRLECMEPFLRPVPKGYMNYHDVIKRPMDLGTIKSKMADGRYLDPSQILLDMDLIWTNCLKFNHPEAPIIEDCENSKREFERLWLAGNVMTSSGAGISMKKEEKVTRTDDWVEQARGALYRLINFVPQASWFYDPVNEEDAPGYRDVVKNPIDLHTISEKLQKGQYPAPGNLLADMDLITKNAEAYNGPDDEITEGARIMDAAFKKYWKNAGLSSSTVVFDSNSDWIPNAIAAIENVLDHPSAGPFAHPVSERTAPGYSRLIKRPMDFSTIKFNLERGSYFSPGQVVDDVAQIFQNCRSYNPPGDEIRAMGSEVESMFRKTWESMGLPVPRKWKKR